VNAKGVPEAEPREEGDGAVDRSADSFRVPQHQRPDGERALREGEYAEHVGDEKQEREERDRERSPDDERHVVDPRVLPGNVPASTTASMSPATTNAGTAA